MKGQLCPESWARREVLQLNTLPDKAITEMVGALTDPIIVHPGGWGDTLPDWLKSAITLERLAMNMKEIREEQPTGTDAEACAYLYTTSFAAPLDSDWVQIYLYVSGKTCSHWGGREIPPDISVDSLNDWQTRQLERLKVWLYQRRVAERNRRDRAERRQQKEAESARREEEQPVLFSF